LATLEGFGFTMRLLLTLMCTAAMCLGVTACGSSTRATKTATSNAAAEGDVVLTVSRELGPIDGDDYAVLNFGHAATGRELRKITALVRRYYAAAVAENGAEACSMLFSVVVREVEEGEGTAAGLHGTSCAQIMSALFKLRHRELVADVKSFKEVRVRIEPPNGRVVLRFSTAVVARELDLRLVDGVWKVRQPLDTPTP
jgi:hypothetical protein